MTNNEIWSAIRGQLDNLRDEMGKAVYSDSYGLESIYLDAIARHLADAVTEREAELAARDQ